MKKEIRRAFLTQNRQQGNITNIKDNNSMHGIQTAAITLIQGHKRTTKMHTAVCQVMTITVRKRTYDRNIQQQEINKRTNYLGFPVTLAATSDWQPNPELNITQM